MYIIAILELQCLRDTTHWAHIGLVLLLRHFCIEVLYRCINISGGWNFSIWWTFRYAFNIRLESVFGRTRELSYLVWK